MFMTFLGQISEKETILASKIIKTLLEEILLLHLILYLFLFLLPQPLECSVYKHAPLHPALNLIFVNYLLRIISFLVVITLFALKEHFVLEITHFICHPCQTKASSKSRSEFFAWMHIVPFLHLWKALVPTPFGVVVVGSFMWVFPNAARGQKSWTNY